MQWLRSTRASLMPKVLHVVHALDPGGAQRLVIEMIRGMQGRRIDSFVCCLDRVGEWAAEVQSLGVPVTTLARKPGFHPVLGRRIAELARANRIDVLHCHQYSPFVYGSFARLLDPRLRLVFTEHGRLADARISWRRKMANRLLRRIPVRTVAVCEDLKAGMVQEGFGSQDIEVVYNGIRLGPRPSLEMRRQARSSLGLEHDALVIGTVARLDAVKDIPTLLQAHDALFRRFPQLQLLILGDGPAQASLQEQAASMGHNHSVRFLGHRSDVRELLPAFDIYVNSSSYEGVSLSIVEAMAAELPVVATRVGGNPEVVLDGRTGLLVPKQENSILAEKIGSLLEDREMSRRFGEAGRRRAEEAFDLDRMIDFYLRIYTQ